MIMIMIKIIIIFKVIVLPEHATKKALLSWCAVPSIPDISSDSRLDFFIPEGGDARFRM